MRLITIKKSEQPEKWVCLLMLAGLTAVLLVSRFYYPEDFPARTLCSFKTLFGLPCPSCGLTRSFCAMAKGELFRAFNFNLLGPGLFLSTAILWLAALLGSFGLTSPLSAFILLIHNIRFIKTSLVLLGLYWIMRIVYLLI